MALQKGINGGGGRHDGNHGKPGYMSHIPEDHLKINVPKHKMSSNMTLESMDEHCGGGGEKEA